MGGEAGRAPSGGLRSCACSRTGWGRHHHHHHHSAPVDCFVPRIAERQASKAVLTITQLLWDGEDSFGRGLSVCELECFVERGEIVCGRCVFSADDKVKEEAVVENRTPAVKPTPETCDVSPVKLTVSCTRRVTMCGTVDAIFLRLSG